MRAVRRPSSCANACCRSGSTRPAYHFAFQSFPPFTLGEFRSLPMKEVGSNGDQTRHPIAMLEENLMEPMQLIMQPATTEATSYLWGCSFQMLYLRVPR